MQTPPKLIAFSNFPRESWDSLNAPGTPPMLRHLWMRTAAEVFARERPAQVLVSGDPKHPSACVALYAPPDSPGTLRLLGALDLGEPADLPARSDEALADLARKLWRLGVPVDLGHLPTDTRLISQLRQQKPAFAMIGLRTRDERGLPALALEGEWSDPAMAIGRRRRQSLARKRRRAEANFGKVRLQMIAPGPETATEDMDLAFAVEANSWKRRAGTAIIQQPRQLEFFRLYGQRAAKLGILRLAFLEIGGAPAAVHYGVEIDNIFWSLRVGYDERFGSVSPGDLLMFDLVKDCVARGVSRFELCGKDADWTRRWSNHSRPIAAVRLYPLTLSGFGSLAGDLTALGLRKTRWRQSKRGARA
ncbi:acetyltransferase (GNAT) family protein [Maritimibacter alkaliphilus HTCC2654]|nr:GNAT family N-acetyltransferase [Maritimibacter alkaliphilus]TYP85259.1 acetyltransferase (GNAT) family protein [Maritimibacter alkaliphilus HTCC2654]